MFSIPTFLIVSWLLLQMPEIITTISTEEYVEAKLRETKELFDKSYSQYPQELFIDEENDSYEGKWTKLWNETLRHEKPRIVRIPQQTFFINGEQVFSMDGISDENKAMTQLNLLTAEPTKFTKIFFWNGTIFMLVCQVHSCMYYQGADIQDLKGRHTINNANLSPVDASFFEHQDVVFLVVAYSPKEFFQMNELAPSELYQWTGSSMILINNFLTPAIKTLAILHHEAATLLILALEKIELSESGHGSSCIIYKFSDHGFMEPISFLDDVGQVTNIYPYHFDGEEYAFLTSDDSSSGIFWWNGFELEEWIKVPEVKLDSSVNVVRLKNETLLFVTDTNLLKIYKMSDHEIVELNDISLISNETIVDIVVWENDESIMLALIKLNDDNTYRVEYWQLDLYRKNPEPTTTKMIFDCLEDLKNLLSIRMPIIENLQRNLSEMLTIRNNTLKNNSLLPKLYLDAGNISLVEFDNPEEIIVTNPVEIRNKLIQLENRVNYMSSSAHENILHKQIVNFTGKIVVDQDVHFQKLHINTLEVEYLNDVKVDFNELLISHTNQTFNVPLQGKKINVDNLEVSSVCGLTSENWHLKNDLVRTKFDSINLNDSRISNDTVSIESGTVSKLNADSINGVKINGFLDNVFIRGENQIITGNVTYANIVKIMNFTVNELNNVSSSNLLTKYTNQSLDEVFLNELEVKHLHVRTINGVLVDEAAKMSEDNIIRGKVTIGNLIITDELTVNENIALPLTHPTQVYDTIFIKGDVIVKALDIEPDAFVTFNNDTSSMYYIDDVLQNSWSKSGDQTIENPVILAKGASIDELNCSYLNNLNESDFVYLDSHEIHGLENVSFAHFHFNKVVNGASGVVENFFDESSNSITFHKAIRISKLSVDNVITQKYNGIPINSIMSGNGSLEFSGVSKFEVVNVEDRMSVEDLKMNRLNHHDVSIIGKALTTSQNLQLKTLKVSDVNMRNVHIKNLNGENFEEALLKQDRLGGRLDPISLTIDGDIEIENNLQVGTVNQITIDDYIHELRNTNSVNLIDGRTMKYLNVIENLTVKSLNGRNVTDYFAMALSRSRKQIVSGELRTLNATINRLATKQINNRDVYSIKFVDEPCTFYGNVSFSELIVVNNTLTATLNGQSISELQENLHVIPLESIENLYVIGDMSWDEPAEGSQSMNYLINNAFTKLEDQVVNSAITFTESVEFGSLYVNEYNSLVLKKINDVVSDTVIDGSSTNVIVINGTKNFEKGISADDLEVSNDIGVDTINGFQVDELNSQTFNIYNNNSISAKITFLEEVEIGNLITNENIHGVPLASIATVDQIMPENLHFKHLVIENSVSLHKLDGVEFDVFNKERVSIRGNNEIFGDVEFISPITVSNYSFVSLINGIKPKNLVVDDDDNMLHVVEGRKTFMSEVTVEGDVETSEINGIEPKAIFGDSISKDENVQIFGNLIFQPDVTTVGGVNVLGNVNDIQPQDIINEKSLQQYLTMDSFRKEESFIEDLVINSINESPKFSRNSLYLEDDNSFDFSLPRVFNIRNMQIGSSTILDVYSSAPGEFCGLPSDCFCRRQTVVDISPSNNYTVQQIAAPEIVFNFFEPQGLYGLKVVSGVVSNNDNCSKSLEETEKSNIYWMKSGELQKTVLELDGFIADARIFVISDKIYLILAIFYDKGIISHATDSLVYEFDIQNEEARLIQTIPTDGAKTIEVFYIPKHGIYALIGCVKGKAESLLLRFDSKSQKFQDIRTFATGGSKHIASINTNNENFVLLNNPDIEALQIFSHNPQYDNFYDYQNLYFQSRVIGVSALYTGAYAQSEVLVVTVTRDGWFYVHEYMLHGKFQLKMSYWMEDIQILSPFHHANQNYLFAGTKSNNTVFKIVQQSP